MSTITNQNPGPNNILIPIEIFMDKRKYSNSILDSTAYDLLNTSAPGPQTIQVIYPRGPLSNLVTESVLQTTNDSWKATVINIDYDSKVITGILNKLNESNYDAMLLLIRQEKYTDGTMLDLLFSKAVREPGYHNLYIQLCTDLALNDAINKLCAETFTRKKHKNLIVFICELYKQNILKALDGFAKILLDELTTCTDAAILNDDVEFILIMMRSSKFDTSIVSRVLEIKNINAFTVLKPRIKFLLQDLIKELSV
jgi:hypothetical protein